MEKGKPDRIGLTKINNQITKNKMKAEITFTIKALKDCTPKQFEEWLKFNLGITRSMSGKNPLADSEFELQPRFGEITPAYKIIESQSLRCSNCNSTNINHGHLRICDECGTKNN